LSNTVLNLSCLIYVWDIFSKYKTGAKSFVLNDFSELSAAAVLVLHNNRFRNLHPKELHLLQGYFLFGNNNT
jgi:hypothetical protein